MSAVSISIEANDNEQVIALKRQIHSLRTQLEYRDRYAIELSNGSLIKSGTNDLYPGEQHDFLISVLQQIKERCPLDSRAYQIISSLLTYNKPIGRAQEILCELERIFRKGLPASEADINALRAIGFSYTPSKKHPKLRFHNEYMFVLPCTPSDRYRGTHNCLAEISKCIAVRQKI